MMVTIKLMVPKTPQYSTGGNSMFENSKVKPLIGIKEIKLLSNYKDVIKILKDNGVIYSVEVWSNKGCTPEEPWKLIKVSNVVTLFFAKEKLWKMYFEEGFTGALDNGIKIGMSIVEATKIDPSIKYDDWEEDFASSNHYWVEESLETKTICSITIFIKEVENDDLFFSYDWAN